MKTSIIIPAHNEASVITATLASILCQVDRGDEVIVVCNGCTDNTADLVKELSKSCVTLFETSVASKSRALNVGDQLANNDLRIYMDGDIKLREGSLSAIKKSFRMQEYLAASTIPVMDYSRANYLVRAYYEAWLSLPYCRRGMLGSGVYILSKDGRARFDEFPEVISDDGFVRALFAESERGNIRDAYSYVTAPATLAWLLKIKTRSRLGQKELAEKYPHIVEKEIKEYGKALFSYLLKPYKLHHLFIYLYVNYLARFKAKRFISNIESYSWERDLSSR
ncbi:glycosyl transferase [Thioflavicoccus mobilis 8321]|uniref:Glycosyl transferase n=1 Tax=Thioflavicoccus mobilis 8321 TaxID=765912 RepID=L0H119_9GAMM|nr:glycosyltransferase family 2 protein [Thioflavicoccus mobilis]AGA91757.1 glycosyl transferase [Thioflavicoccus mobilis 8321]